MSENYSISQLEEEFRPGGQASLLAPDDVMAAGTHLLLFLVLACLTLACLILLARRPLSFHHRQLAWRLFTSLFALTVFIFLLSIVQTVRAANDRGRDVQTAQLGPVSSPWVSADIGTVGVTGSADETSGTYTVNGAGASTSGTTDAFHYVYQSLTGDGSITANAVSLSGGGAAPRMGLMMRDSLAEDAAYVAAVVQGNRIWVADRATTGGNATSVTGYNQGAPEWLRIERSGNTFTLSRSNDGSSWSVMQTRTITMGTTIYMGMAVTGDSTTTLATGIFDNVATTGSGPTPTPAATNTPLPTNTPAATNTPVPTNTPIPTNTPPPSPTPAPDVWIKRSSYSIAGQMVAFRVTGDPANSGLFYVLSDHLGSTSMLVNSSGGTVTGSTTRYLPFGGYRGTAPSQSITDQDFTGQKENMELGLLYYQARFYVPYLNRFLSADTIIPDPANPQSYNRYAYARNNPLNRNDPTGHVDCSLLGDSGDIQGCNDSKPAPSTRLSFQAEDWEIELLTMVVINEIAGQPVRQVEYAAWTVLNRYNAEDLQTRSGFESRIESILIGSPKQYHAAFGYDVKTETFKGEVFLSDLAGTGPLGREVISDRYAVWLNSQPYATQERIDAVIGVVDAYNSGAAYPTNGADTFYHVPSINNGGAGGAYWAEQARLAAVTDNSPQAAAATGWVEGNGFVRPRGLSMDMAYWKQWGR